MDKENFYILAKLDISSFWNNDHKREISTKRNPNSWEKISVHELRGHLDRHGFICSLDIINCILKSFFVERFNPIESYFLAFEGNEFVGTEDYIHKLANYVHLKNPTSIHKNYWYTLSFALR